MSTFQGKQLVNVDPDIVLMPCWDTVAPVGGADAAVGGMDVLSVGELVDWPSADRSSWISDSCCASVCKIE